MAKELVWIDLEMTGLNPQIHRIIEIATIITDSELNIIAKGPDLVINASDEELSKMNSYVTEMHTKSGLIEEVKNSKLTIRDAEIETLNFINKHIKAKNKPPVCGNSIGTDRRFLDAQMNDLENFSYQVRVSLWSVLICLGLSFACLGTILLDTTEVVTPTSSLTETSTK